MLIYTGVAQPSQKEAEEPRSVCRNEPGNLKLRSGMMDDVIVVVMSSSDVRCTTDTNKPSVIILYNLLPCLWWVQLCTTLAERLGYLGRVDVMVIKLPDLGVGKYVGLPT